MLIPGESPNVDGSSLPRRSRRLRPVRFKRAFTGRGTYVIGWPLDPVPCVRELLEVRPRFVHGVPW